MAESGNHAIFKNLCNAFGLPVPVSEYKFHESRKWKFDFAYPDKRIAIEVEGGVYGKGKKCPACKQRKRLGHTSVQGVLRDIEKYNAAAVRGWIVYRITPDDLYKSQVYEDLKKLLHRHEK